MFVRGIDRPPREDSKIRAESMPPAHVDRLRVESPKDTVLRPPIESNGTVGEKPAMPTVAIVGGGPHALAILSALYERSFSSPHADVTAFTARVGYCGHEMVGSVKVIDPSTQFMDRWDRQFELLDLEHLRSPMYIHPETYDAHALLNFAVKEGRTDEIYHVPTAEKRVLAVGAATQQNLLEGLPGTKLFHDFCMHLKKKHLHEWHQGTVIDVCKCATTNKYKVAYEVNGKGGYSILADAVVLATGPQGSQNIPDSFKSVQDCPLVLHTEELFELKGSLGDVLSERVPGIRSPSVLIVGGGVTAVQTALAAVKLGCKVVMQSRRELQTRSFDLAGEWFDRRHSNRLRFEFFERTMAERAQFLKAAKGGGSTPASYVSELQKLSSDVFELRVGTEVESAHVHFNATRNLVCIDDEAFHLVILATGVAAAPCQTPLMQRLQQNFPTEIVNNAFPELDSTLRWRPDEDVFVVGGNAAMQLGPGAMNLMGAMQGAKIVGEQLHGLVWRLSDAACARCNALAKNMFALLADSDDDGDDDSEDSDDDTDSASDGR